MEKGNNNRALKIKVEQQMDNPRMFSGDDPRKGPHSDPLSVKTQQSICFFSPS